MHCGEFEDRLNDVLDQRQRPEWDPALDEHMGGCAACRETARAYRAVLDGFHALVAPEAPVELSARVLADLPPRGSRVRRAGLVAALAAAVVVAVMPLWRGTSRTTAKTEVKLVRPNPALASVRSVWKNYSPAPSLLIDDGPPGERYSNLAKETGQSLASVVLFLPGVGGTAGILDADGPTDRDGATWSGSVSEGLKPIAQSVTQTFNLLLGAWPSNGSNSRS